MSILTFIPPLILIFLLLWLIKKIRKHRIAKPKKPVTGIDLIISGYICGLVAFFVFPPGFAVAGTAIGIVNLTKGRLFHGIAQVVISVTCGIFGMIRGAFSCS